MLLVVCMDSPLMLLDFGLQGSVLFYKLFLLTWIYSKLLLVLHLRRDHDFKISTLLDPH